MESFNLSPDEACLVQYLMSLLKIALTSAPVLTFANFLTNAAPFILDVDYFDIYKNIGFILSQEQSRGSGKELVITARDKYSRTVTE